ncbi:MAG: crossover junction endodeoxyribonuclease RuvC [Candidatus Calescibacterium sp.]|nr:crossover junction endodeoxyribonuclease RuvC [Candidatus Calescibacterium sp.]MCX7971906.1 crossover junction endodeoxyribonuclease RuvC [bacterium]MDW8194995.1 crossover junction endodeoxyribonuclease RuvC [Candidatus Calescibacterium sp.]
MKSRRKNNGLTIIGIDAGTTRVGFAVLKKHKKQEIKIIQYGLMPIKSKEHDLRIKQIYEYTRKLIKKYKPTTVVVERLYYHLNRKTAFEVSQAIGVINLACTQLDTSLSLINPTQVKKIITNKGNANKKEIQNQIISKFNGQIKNDKKSLIDDVTDAIAIALSFIMINLK